MQVSNKVIFFCSCPILLYEIFLYIYIHLLVYFRCVSNWEVQKIKIYLHVIQLMAIAVIIMNIFIKENFKKYNFFKEPSTYDLLVDV